MNGLTKARSIETITDMDMSIASIDEEDEGQEEDEYSYFSHKRQNSFHSFDDNRPRRPNISTAESDGLLDRSTKRFNYRTMPSTPTHQRKVQFTPRRTRSMMANLKRSISFTSSDDLPKNKPQYDDTLKEELAALGLQRVYFQNYTTIDWLHDFVKDSIRMKKLSDIPSLRGKLSRTYDASKGWILAFWIGLVTAIIAYIIDVSEAWLFDLKFGYCDSSFFHSENRCTGTFVKWSDKFASDNAGYYIYIFFAISFALLSSLLTLLTKSVRSERGKTQVTYLAAGSGIPEVKTILSGFVIRQFLGLKTLCIKAVGLILSVASGMSLGKEGPFVHIACCVGNISCRMYNAFAFNDGRRREILSASSAAGVAVAFGAPIGGVLFSLEEVSYFFASKTMWRSFFCAMVATISLKLLNPFGTGSVIVFKVHYTHQWHFLEMFVFILLGICGGVYGAVFGKLNILWGKTFRKTSIIQRYPVVEVLFIVTITAVSSYVNVYMRVSGTELVRILLSECEEAASLDGLCPTTPDDIPKILKLLMVAMIAKMILTTVTFGMKIPAGIFIPTMCVGAAFGRSIGLFAQWLFYKYPDLVFFRPCDSEKCVIPGIYAMVGAAAALAGVTRMTVSLAVIMFELTGSLDYVVPFMVAVLVSKWCADAIEYNGIYDLVIEEKSMPYLDGKRDYIFNEQIVDILPSTSLTKATSIDITQTQYYPAAVLQDKLATLRDSGCWDGGLPIVKDEMLIGFLHAAELKHCLKNLSNMTVLCYVAPAEGNDNRTMTYFLNQDPTDLSGYIDQSPMTLGKNAPIQIAYEMFKRLGLRYLCIVNEGKLIGVIYKKQFISYLNSISTR